MCLANYGLPPLRGKLIGASIVALMDVGEIKMILVKEIVDSAESGSESGIVLGGSSANVSKWPYNPDGEPLLLIATIECAVLNSKVEISSLPAQGKISIFSTYKEAGYFLENITYSGDPSELKTIESGYTSVKFSTLASEKESPIDSIPKTITQLRDKEFSDEDFPVCSMCSQIIPNGLSVPREFSENYEFILQIYSSDMADPFKDAFYLTDAIGYLFLNRNKSGEGVFFIQTA